MSQITVILPNFRRQTLKVTPNTTILEVIDQVCEKSGLDSEEYDLKHHRNILDSTTTVRFASLPQNAQLELVEAKSKRKESIVVLCVQLENSERLQGECHPTDTLWHVLMKIAPQQIQACSNPVVIYMRREIIGLENLKATNLRSIGLSGGRAVVRLIDKSLEQLRTQANISGLLTRTSNKEKIEKDEKLNPSDLSTTKKEIEENVIKLTAKTEEFDNKVAVDDSKKEKTHADNRDVTNLDVPENINNIEVVHANIKLHSSEESEEVMNCKRARTKSPENQIQIEVEKVVLLGERNAVVYNLDTIQSPTIEELPDDFYELTIADVQSLAKAARRALKEIEESPLLTAAQRKLDEDGLILQKLSSHKSCVIRVKFPDRTVLQGVFKPLETAEEVYNFVKYYLEDPDLKFCLYTTPPKNILKPETRLVEADCVPGANIYLGPLTDKIPKSFLKSEVLEKFSTFSAVTHEAHGLRGNSAYSCTVKPEPMCTQPNMSVDNSKPGPSKMKPTENLKSQSKNNNSDVPKWFKFGK